MLQIPNRTRHAIALSSSVSVPPCAAVRRRTMLSLTCGPSAPEKLRTCITTTRLRSPQTVSVFASPFVFRSLSAGVRTSGRRGTGGSATLQERNRKVAIYMASVVAGVLGISYAAVPLYKAFCQMTGFGGTTQVADAEKAKKMSPVDGGRVIRVSFDGSVSDTMPWKFRPTQSDVRVVPGETALAFFTAKNPSPKHITGVATYNVFPLKAGIYFNKIQCFCFEEQRLRAGEEIDMPVFFFLDPEMLDDPAMDNVNSVTLSYTFFQTAEEDAVDEEEDDEDEDEEQGEDEARGASAGGGVTHGGQGQVRRDGAKRRWWVFSA